MFTPNSKVCARAACDLGTYKLALSLDDMIDNTMELQSASPFRTTPEQSSTQSSDSGADDEERHLEPFSRRAFQPYHSQSVSMCAPVWPSMAQVASGLPITTMMLRNIPNKYSQNSLLREINEFGFAGTYDFFYLPMDVHNRSNVGYAFINFETEEGAQRFRLAFSNHRFQRFHSRKIGSVCVAHVQGLTANLRHFENRAVTQARNDQYRPLVLRGHQRLDFDHAVTSAKAKEAPAQMTCPVERVGPAEVQEGVLRGNRKPADFFHNEYALDYDIAMLKETKGVLQVAVWNGIVMGGGVGLSIHSPIRIATEKTMFAMPETGIGLFPDVGATWALPRLSGGRAMGTFLGLTGQRLHAADCLRAGVATHYCPSEKLPEVEANLEALGDQASDLQSASTAVQAAAGGAGPDSSKAILEANAAAIERCFGADVNSAEDIVMRLEAEKGEWAEGVLKTLRRMSPTSVKVSLEAIRRHSSPGISLKDAFVMEYRMSQWFMRPQPHSDFCEGIRALLVDKDNQPRWDPAQLEGVSDDRVAGFFEPLTSEHPHGELRL